MSDFYVSFIPEEPEYVFDAKTINSIKNFKWFGDNSTIAVNDTIQFAHAGANFERVLCPFCQSNLMDWWGNAMDKAYSRENGFINLSVCTPCCHKATTLHNLDYFFPQGFYKSIIEMQPCYHQGVIQVPQEIHKDVICEQLFQITNQKWRIINTHL